jgi:hypothetical protein
MKNQKVRITAKEDTQRRYAVVFMGVKLAVAFGRDSGAKVGYDARMISGKIGSGGSAKNWYCIAYEGSVFELEVDAEFFRKNQNRIKKWDIEEIDEYSMSKERTDDLKAMDDNIE